MNLKIGTVGPTFPPVRNVIKQARRNEEKNFDSIWFPDHLMGMYPQSIWTPEITTLASYQPSPHIFMETTTSMTLAANVTRKLTIGSSVIDPFRRHPSVLAQCFVTMDHISKGRIVLGIGTGERMNLEPYGIDISKPVSRLREAIEIIKMLWKSSNHDKVRYKGEFWELEDAVFDLPPYEDRFPPIWIGAHGPRMLELTGKYGDGWIPTNLSLEEYSDKLNKIKKKMTTEGRDPSDLTPALYASIIIENSESSCLDTMDSPIFKAGSLALPSQVFERHGVSHPLGNDLRGLIDYIPSKLLRKEVMQAIDEVPIDVVKERYLYGSPEDIIGELEKYISKGLEHVIFWNETYFADAEKLGPSYKYLQEVVDYFKKT